MSFAPELTVLGYVTDPTRRRVLLVHRIARSSDEQLGKYNGLGGKVEPGEDVVAAMRRELMEEAALDATDLELRGTVSWPGFNGRDVFGFVFLITGFTGVIPDSNEGRDARLARRRDHDAAADVGRRPALPTARVRRLHRTVPRRHPLRRRAQHRMAGHHAAESWHSA